MRKYMIMAVLLIAAMVFCPLAAMGAKNSEEAAVSPVISYSIENDKVVDSQVAETEGESHEAVGLWLVMRGVNAVICGNIGPGSLGALAAAGIVALAGVEGNADEAIEKFILGELAPTSSPNCSGHHGGGCHSHCASGCGTGGCASHCASGCGGCHHH